MIEIDNSANREVYKYSIKRHKAGDSADGAASAGGAGAGAGTENAGQNAAQNLAQNVANSNLAVGAAGNAAQNVVQNLQSAPQPKNAAGNSNLNAAHNIAQNAAQNPPQSAPNSNLNPLGALSAIPASQPARPISQNAPQPAQPAQPRPAAPQSLSELSATYRAQNAAQNVAQNPAQNSPQNPAQPAPQPAVDEINPAPRTPKSHKIGFFKSVLALVADKFKKKRSQSGANSNLGEAGAKNAVKISAPTAQGVNKIAPSAPNSNLDENLAQNETTATTATAATAAQTATATAAQGIAAAPQIAAATANPAPSFPPRIGWLAYWRGLDKKELAFSLFLIVAAAFLGYFCRLYWIDWASGQWQYMWDGELMISTNDGYLFAEGVRDLINGGYFTPDNQPNDMSAVGLPFAKFTFFCIKIVNFFIAIANGVLFVADKVVGLFGYEIAALEYSSVDSILTQIPLHFAPLVAVPLFLIGRECGSKAFGFIAALIAPISVAYYNRTTAGYYDTDILVITLPMFFAWALVRLALKRDTAALIAVAITGTASVGFYTQSIVICGGSLAIFFVYALIFATKSRVVWFGVALGLIALADVNVFWREGILLAALVLYFVRREWATKAAVIIALFAVGAALHYVSGFINMIMFQLRGYIFGTIAEGKAFYFFDVYRTIAEAGKVNMDFVIGRLGGRIVCALSAVGLVWLFLRRPVALIVLPFLTLSLLSVKAGGRFVMYGDCVVALGLGHLIGVLCGFAVGQIRIWGFLRRRVAPAVEVAVRGVAFAGLVAVVAALVYNFTQTRHELWLVKGFALDWENFYFKTTLVLALGVAGGLLYAVWLAAKRREFVGAVACVASAAAVVFAINPLINNAMNFRTGSVMHPNEIRVLKDIQKIATPEDYVVSWWDYGYPIRYFANVKTLVDGAKHLGQHNFGPSFVFARDQISGANMARLDVEYTEKSYREKDAMTRWLGSTIFDMTIDYGYANIDDFLKQQLPRKDLKMPEKTRDVFIYIPQSMLRIMGTVFIFSRRDVMSGNSWGGAWIVDAMYPQDKNGVFDVGNFQIRRTDATFWGKGSNEIHQLNRFITVDYPNNKHTKTEVLGNPNSQYYAIHLRNYNRIYFFNAEMYNSLFVQLFMLENYDPDVFELVSSNAWAKAWRLKR